MSESTLFFRDVGYGQPVIFLHGHSQNNRIFWGLEHFLAFDHRVILIDSRGHGKSARGSFPLLISLMAKDVIAVMDSLGIERCAIVGFSDGANIALQMAVDFPERLTSIVAISGNVRPEGVNPFYLKFLSVWKYIRSALHMDTDMIDLILNQPQISDDALGSIVTPTLLIYGSLDLITWEHIHRLHKCILGSQLKIIRGARHINIVQKWRRYAGDVADFITPLQ